MMNGKSVAGMSAVLAGLLVAMIGLSGQALGQSPRVVSKFGHAQVEGRDVIVHVTVVVPPGANANRVALDAVRNQGARPFQSDEFSTSGLVWDQFFDTDANNDFDATNDFVKQNYNPVGDPTVNGGEIALMNTQGTWSDVTLDSKFEFKQGVIIDNCPSLVKECKGRQFFDGKNDVAWLPIKGCCTLAVTWFSTSVDEADMALNTNFPWSTSGDGIYFDVETVMLHENGHVLGLGHSAEEDAVMFATYSVMRRGLADDDALGVRTLYPLDGPKGSISGTVTDAPTNGNPIPEATVVVVENSFFTTTDLQGKYLIESVPVGTYSLTASASGFIGSLPVPEVEVSLDETTPEVDFALESDGSPPDPLVISSVYAEKSGKGGAFKILWITEDHPADSQVEFTCCGVFTNSELVTVHSMSFRGQKGVLYTYSVTSIDAGGISVTLGGFSHQN